MATAWERWELASFEAQQSEASDAVKSGSAPQKQDKNPEPAIKLPTAEEIEQIYQQAREEGLRQGKEEGHQAGYQAGQAIALAEANRLGLAAGKLEQSLNTLESAIADELLALAIELAREVVRHEIATQPESLLPLVREALAQLPHQHAAIYLHPEDASLLRSYIGDQLAHAGHRIHEDYKLARGDCVIEAGGTQIDATVAMRWQRVLSNLGIASVWQPTTVQSTQTYERSDREVTPSAQKGLRDGGLNES